jgi:hypothetical protein
MRAIQSLSISSLEVLIVMPRRQAIGNQCPHLITSTRLFRHITTHLSQQLLRIFLNTRQYTPARQYNTARSRAQATRLLHRTDKTKHPISSFPAHTQAIMTQGLLPPIPCRNSRYISPKTAISRRISVRTTRTRVSRRGVISIPPTQTHDPSYNDITAILRLIYSMAKLVQRG